MSAETRKQALGSATGPTDISAPRILRAPGALRDPLTWPNFIPGLASPHNVFVIILRPVPSPRPPGQTATVPLGAQGATRWMAGGGVLAQVYRRPYNKPVYLGVSNAWWELVERGRDLALLKYRTAGSRTTPSLRGDLGDAVIMGTQSLRWAAEGGHRLDPQRSTKRRGAKRDRPHV